MSNFKPKNSRKRKYNPDSSSNCCNLNEICESSPVKISAQSTETWSSFLSNLSVDLPNSNIDNNTKKNISDKIIKTENYQNISCDIKCENEIKRVKPMKTKLNSDILSKSSYNSNENSINEENPNFSSHITSTPVKKSQIKHLKNSSFNLSIPSDVNSSIVSTPHRSIRQKSKLDTKKTLKTFRGEMSMRNHMKIVHLCDEFPWKCSDCGTKFSVLLDFKSHKKIAHKKDVKNWTCYICGEMDELMYRCHYCRYSSASLSLYQVHLNGHKVDRSLIQCHHCDKSFDRRNAMNDHMKSFHRDEKLECRICGFKSADLSQHIASVHTGEPKMCDICGQQFKHKRDLQMHKKKIHDAQPLGKCDICGVSLPDYYYRKKHMLAHDKHVDENGQYLPLPGSEIEKLDGIIKRRMNHPSRYVSEMCGSDEPIPDPIIDVAGQLANVLSNSKMTDTSDLKFFVMQNNKHKDLSVY